MSVAPRPVVERTVLLVGLGNYTHPTTRHSIGQYVLGPLLNRAVAHDRTIRAELARAPMRGTTYALPSPVEPTDFTFVRSAKGWIASATVLIDSMPPKGSAKRKAEVKYPIIHANVLFYIPKYLMNQNGLGVAAACAAYQEVKFPQDVLLLHDELSRSFGKVSFKKQGSAGGHNGVRSVLSVCCRQDKTMDLARLRVGIDRPVDNTDVSRYVLSEMPANWLAACKTSNHTTGEAVHTDVPPILENVWKSTMQWIVDPLIP
ncbi:hypothetical protein MPSI1_000883 [Malassezia psittaci]|uniref:peptidyl-tRNA hydrolase n=1 Tax=Malassezia psittaci TaxID=1821823 RepID=A0AAF0F7V7_9BASI|nr:hypothetical protein MPSI1_000883 [Malassezia psittaci]